MLASRLSKRLRTLGMDSFGHYYETLHGINDQFEVVAVASYRKPR